MGGWAHQLKLDRAIGPNGAILAQQATIVDAPDAGTLEVFERFASETSLASPSPTLGGGRLYVLFGTGQLLAYSKGGEILWQRDLTATYGEPRLYFGMSSSPLYHEGRLYLQLMHGGRQAVAHQLGRSDDP